MLIIRKRNYESLSLEESNKGGGNLIVKHPAFEQAPIAFQEGRNINCSFHKSRF